MNVQSTTDDERATVLVDTEHVTVLATIENEARVGDVLETLSVVDQQLLHGHAVPAVDARVRTQDVAADGGTQS